MLDTEIVPVVGRTGGSVDVVVRDGSGCRGEVWSWSKPDGVPDVVLAPVWSELESTGIATVDAAVAPAVVWVVGVGSS